MSSNRVFVRLLKDMIRSKVGLGSPAIDDFKGKAARHDLEARMQPQALGSADAIAYRGASFMTAALPVSTLAIGAAALLADGNAGSALDLAFLSMGCVVLAILRSFRPRGVIVTSEGLENRTGMFRRDFVRWADVIQVRRERPGVLVLSTTDTTRIRSDRSRDVVLRGSDELGSLIGQRDGPSLELPIREALSDYRRRSGQPLEDAPSADLVLSWAILQWLLVAGCVAVVLIVGIVAFRWVANIAPSWSGRVRQVGFLAAGLAAVAPAATVPGWAGPRLPAHATALLGWRPAADLVPFLIPWIVMLAIRVA